MNTTKNNKLIAEFMSIPVINETSGIITPMYKAVGLGGWCREDELKYNLRWDWLMPVVEKIEDLVTMEALPTFAGQPFSVEVGAYGVQVTADNGLTKTPFKKIAGKLSKIERTYKAVVQFIKWYNENK